MSGNSIADSSAVSVPRMLSQHQAAITMLDELLTNRPEETPFDWLDLACGRGQILSHLKDALPEDAKRARIRYFGFDVDNSYVREADARAKSLNFAGADITIGQLDHFHQIVPPDQKYSFITFTNVVHELPPRLFGSLLLELILRMKPTGTLYIFDMESLADPELGAITWDNNEVRRLLTFIYKELGAAQGPPGIPRWPYSSCVAWSFRLQREKLDVGPDAFAQKMPELKTKIEAFIIALFKERFERTKEALEDLTNLGGAETGEEQTRKMKLLYDFWSLSRL